MLLHQPLNGAVESCKYTSMAGHRPQTVKIELDAKWCHWCVGASGAVCAARPCAERGALATSCGGAPLTSRADLASPHTSSTWRPRAATRSLRDHSSLIGRARQTTSSHWPSSLRAPHIRMPRTSSAHCTVYSVVARYPNYTAPKSGTAQHKHKFCELKESFISLNVINLIRMSTMLEVCGPLSPPSTPPLMENKVSFFCF